MKGWETEMNMISPGSIGVAPGFTLSRVFSLTPTLADNKDKRGLALDGQLKHEDTNLASSTMWAITESHFRNNYGSGGGKLRSWGDSNGDIKLETERYFTIHGNKKNCVNGVHYIMSHCRLFDSIIAIVLSSVSPFGLYLKLVKEALKQRNSFPLHSILDFFSWNVNFFEFSNDLVRSWVNFTASVWWISSNLWDMRKFVLIHFL